MTALGAALIAAKRSEGVVGEFEVAGAIHRIRELLGLPAIDQHPPLLDWASRMAREQELPPLGEGETDPPQVDHGPPINGLLRGVDTGSFARRGDHTRPATYQRSDDDREAKRRAKLVELAVWTLHSDEGCTVRTDAGLLPTHDPYKQHQAMAVRIVDALHPKGAL